MLPYRGVIIEESLADKSVLDLVRIVETKVSAVTDKSQTPWLSEWTLHTVEVAPEDADNVADVISHSFDQEHPGSWYADFKNDEDHYIIYPNQIYKVELGDPEGYAEAAAYGIELGIPEDQVDFAVDLDEYESGESETLDYSDQYEEEEL